MDKFSFELLSPTKRVLSVMASEVVLPAYDGEVGVLPEHADFVGLLGSGPLKYVKEGNDHWILVSIGTYQVKDGKLTVAAETVEEPKDIDLEAAKNDVVELEKSLLSVSPEKIDDIQTQLQKAKGRLEVHRRTQLN
jgi:F-type H+-transporting ATPase subunit epsilon